jgi:hypothetical protein
MARARAVLEPLDDGSEQSCPCGARATRRLTIDRVWGGAMTFVYCKWCGPDALEQVTRLIEPSCNPPKRDRLRHPGKKVASFGSGAAPNAERKAERER